MLKLKIKNYKLHQLYKEGFNTFEIIVLLEELAKAPKIKNN